MKNSPSRSKEAQILAAGQTHNDLHPGHGVIAEATHDDIANRAYDIYVKSDCEKGRCTKNWQQAEHELKTAGHRA